MNKQQFKNYFEQYTGGDVLTTDSDFQLAWHMFNKGDREGYKRGAKAGYKRGLAEYKTEREGLK